jgi:hypothetical protein
VPSVGLTVANNEIFGRVGVRNSTTGIRVLAGADITIAHNQLRNVGQGITVYPGIKIACIGEEPATHPAVGEIVHVSITGNSIRDTSGPYFIRLDSTRQVEVAGNFCHGGPNIIFGILADAGETDLSEDYCQPDEDRSAGEDPLPKIRLAWDNRQLWIHHNRVGGIEGGGTIGVASSSATDGFSRDIVIEDNICEFAVLSIGNPPFTRFGNGDVLRRNAWLGDRADLDPDQRERLAFGAGNVCRTFPNGTETPSVLGGELFATGNTEVIQIRRVEEGYVGQVVHILARDDKTTILHEGGIDGNIRLAGALPFNMARGDTLSLILFPPDPGDTEASWEEFGRKVAH